MTTPTKPADLRGHELLRHVLAIIEQQIADESKRRDSTYWGTGGATEAGTWNQATWGYLTDSVLADAHVVDSFSSTYWSDQIVTVDGLADLVMADNACGTAMCFAGHTVVLTDQPVLVNRESGLFEGVVVDKDTSMSVGIAAKELLGLTHEQADALFDGDNTIEDIRAIIALIEIDGSLDDCSCCGRSPWRCEDCNPCPGCAEMTNNESGHCDDCECKSGD